MIPPDAGANQYIIDIEDAAETARLIDQDTLFTQAMGGLFPEQTDLSQVTSVLDLACGPGGWVINVAFTYPSIEVIGVDISRTMVDYANAYARSQYIRNASFKVMDIVQPLDFSEATFDLVHARFVAGVLSIHTWPAMIAECFRILKPGGMLCMSEAEVGISSSEALQHLNGQLYQAFRQQHRTFSMDGHSIGIVHMLAPLLRMGGFQQIGRQPFVLDASAEEPLHYQFSKDVEITYRLLKPYLLNAAVVTAKEFEELYQQTLIDMYQPTFLNTTFGLTCYGRKPERHEEGETRA